MFALNDSVDNVFDQFQDDMEEALGIPYCQVVNPRTGLTSNEIKKNPKNFGLIIPKDQADAVGFTPSGDWTSEQITIVVDDKEIVIDCWHSHQPKFLVISRSQLEVQEATEKGWRYAGIAYDRGQLTPIGRLAQDDADARVGNYRRVVRYLLVFIDDQGNPLQNEPLALTGRGGFGGSFGKEVSEFFKEFDKAYCIIRKTRKRFSAYAQAFLVHAHENGFFKPKGDKMAYSCTMARVSPVAGAGGEVISVERGDRTVSLHTVPATALMISKSSETGKKVAQWFSDYQSFAKPNRGQGEAIDEPVQQFIQTGFIEEPEWTNNGKCQVKLVYNGQQQTVILPTEETQECLNAVGEYTVTGILQAGIVIAESVVMANGPAVSTEPANQGKLAGVGF